MKKILLPLCLLMAMAIPSKAQTYEIWVSPDGSDLNPGTIEKPMATLALSLRKARELRRLNDPGIKEGIHIILKEGIYSLYEPVYVRTEDWGVRDVVTP